MTKILALVKGYMSTTSFLLLSFLVYTLGGSQPTLLAFIGLMLPANGGILAFITFLGLIILFEISLRHRNTALSGYNTVKEELRSLKVTLEQGQLISDVNAAFAEFKASGRTHITGKYYIKEILSLEDRRAKLQQNSYTQSKLKFLVGAIKIDKNG